MQWQEELPIGESWGEPVRGVHRERGLDNHPREIH
jgi:hypothetical protein